jgi:hypothetical protein
MFNGKPQATASFLGPLGLSSEGMKILSGMALVRRQPLLCRLDILVRQGFDRLRKRHPLPTLRVRMKSAAAGVTHSSGSIASG